MMKRKSPIAALGLATGAVALQPIWPVIQKFFLTLNITLANMPNLQSVLLTVERFLQNGYYHLAVVNVWNYLIILAAVILEGPIATMLGGVWASMGRVNLWAILLISMLAGVLADTFWYYLGHFGREQMIERWGRYLRIDLATINKMEQVLFGQDATQVIFTSKLTSALIIPTLVAAGLTGMGWRRVMRTIIPAQFLWSAGMIGVGFIAADSFVLISQKVENFGWIVGGVLVLVLGGRIVYRWRKIPQ